jgi:16S rRNA (guanine527-N7)-methyltransferase
VERIKKYFPDLSSLQLQRLEQLQPFFIEWNARINLISRKDMDQFFLHHVLHSLSLLKVVRFTSGTRIMDVGTGGGFPGIPLAICLPECEFLLVDSIGKKIKVVQTLIEHLSLSNVKAHCERAEKIDSSFDFIVSRAVTALPVFWQLVRRKINPGGFNDIPNGVLYLKGGDIHEELATLKAAHKVYPLASYFKESYFETKCLVHLFDRSPAKKIARRNNS